MPVRDKEKQATYGRAHYERNKPAVKARAAEFKKISKKRNQAFVNRVKHKFGCSKCGFNAYTVALDFHHIGEKSDNIGTMALKGCSIKKIKEEMRKCVILCANCHRFETSIERLSDRFDMENDTSGTFVSKFYTR